MKIFFSILFLVFFITSAFSQGWTKLNTTGSIEARTNASAIYIPSSNRMVLFGGNTSNGFTNELWTLDLNTNTWNRLIPKSVKLPSPRYTHIAMYDTTGDRMLIWSGQGNAGILFNDIWAFNLKDSTWEELFPDGNVAAAPLKRYGTATIFDPLSRNLVSFAGFTTSGRFDDTWSFNTDTHEWTNRTNTYFPLKRCLTSQSFAADRREMILFGGQSTGNLNDVWTLNTDSYLWTNRSPSERPIARHFASSIYANNGFMVLFGGDSLGQGNTAGAINDLSAFELNKQEWTKLPQPGVRPASRYGHTAVYTYQDRMIIFGGTGTTLFNDTWVYSGISSVTGIKKNENNKTVLTCQPNPSDGKAAIRFNLLTSSGISFTLRDVRGSIIAAPLNIFLNAGDHSINLNDYSLPPGLYIGTLKNNVLSKSVKIHIQ